VTLVDVNDLGVMHRTTYDELADEYEAKAGYHLENTRIQVERLSPFVFGERRVLDVGCAVGLAMSLMARMQMIPVGVDISPQMASYACRRNPGRSVLVGDFLRLDFGERFDAIYAQSFIHLFPKDIAVHAVRRMWELLESDGALFMSTTIEGCSDEGWSAKADYAGHAIRFRKLWQREEFVNVMEHCGFRMVRHWDLVDPFGKNWMIYISRKSLHDDLDA
jgi:SAM-dependent methyltransferase